MSALSAELEDIKSERDIIEAKLLALNKSHVDLYHRFEKLSESLPSHVTMEEHQKALANVQGYVSYITATYLYDFLICSNLHILVFLVRRVRVNSDLRRANLG